MGPFSGKIRTRDVDDRAYERLYSRCVERDSFAVFTQRAFLNAIPVCLKPR
jgi:hypothetical protein